MTDRGLRRRRKTSDIVQQPWVKMINPFKPLRLISDDEVEALHGAALRILEETGIRCHVAEARNTFRKAGARVDDATAQVSLGREIVEHALTTVPSQVTLTPRRREHAVVLGGQHMATSTVLGPPHVTDLVRGRRTGTLGDLKELLKLTQFFNIVHMNGFPLEAQDVEVRFRHLDTALAMLTLTDKVPALYCQSRQRLEDVLTLCAMARGETLEQFGQSPGAYAIINTNTPLQYDVPMTIGVMDMARHGQPTLITPFILAGASTPNTLASAIALNTAEILFGVVLAQLVRPGAPVVHGLAVINVDMKTGAPAYGWADMHRGTMIGAQMARRYNMPIRTSIFSSPNTPDYMAGSETAMAAMTAMASGGHLFMHATGWLEGGLCTSLEKFVLDCELMQNIAHIMQPADISDNALALQEIKDIGPGGHFFGTERTIASYESAFYRPLVGSTQNYGAWAEAGAKNAAERATAIWQEVLRVYEEPQLDPARLEKMTAFVAKRKEEGGAPLD
jgi:trimethylamine---corrinoid protein Co-methyltransferase